MIRLHILFLLLFTLHIQVSAQKTAQQKADSLLVELGNARPDTNKFIILQELSSVYFQENPELGVKYGKEALDFATEIKFESGIMRGNNLVARCYAVQRKLPEALKYFQAGLDMARKLNKPRHIGIFLSSISAIYTQNGDFDKALKYAMEAKEVNEKAGIKYMVNLMTNIGYLYSNNNQPEEALKYYFEGARQEEEYGNNNNKGELGNLYLNIGSTHVRMGKYAEALYYFFKAKDLLIQVDHAKNLAIALDDIGGVYLEITRGKGPYPDSLRDNNANLIKSEMYLQQALVLAEKLQLMDIREDVYSSLSELYSIKYDYEKAYRYYKKKIAVRDSMRNIDEEKALARVEAEYTVKKQTDSLHYQNALKDKEIGEKKLQRNMGIVLVAMVGIIGLLIINRQKLKHEQRRKEAEAETIRITELAKQQLRDFTKSIQEKNELIDKFTVEIEKYQALPCSNDLPEKERSLEQLQNSVILTDEQWQDFQSLFNKVHSGFINRAKNKFSDLTTAELRFVLLTKLGLNNKEMASMLGVSMEAVRVSKHRLLKKIQLPEGVALEDTVNTI